jgi:hypothetical protein
MFEIWSPAPLTDAEPHTTAYLASLIKKEEGFPMHGSLMVGKDRHFGTEYCKAPPPRKGKEKSTSR